MNGCEIVVVTGFGPFRQFFVNLSWEAAQGLKMVGLGERIDIYVKELPVSYVKTQQIIADIWKSLRPKFALHMGVARGCRGIILEQTGRNAGYRDRDVCGFRPHRLCCVEGGAEKLDSLVNMRTIWKELKQAGVDILYSRDAGRYLCDFAYYCSLYHGERRAALVHLPSSGGLASADRLVPLLQTLLRTMLAQLEDQPATPSQTFQPPQATETL